MQKGIVFKRFFAWILCLIFLFTSVDSYCFDLQSVFDKQESVQKCSVPSLKMFAGTEKIESPINIRTLFCPKNQYLEMVKIYDNNESTIGGFVEPTWVTVDLSAQRNVAGVRFLPAGNANRCLGIKFYVSKDNRNFVPASAVEPTDGGEYTADWKEIIFGGTGQYRYVKIEMPAGAYLAEAQWLTYPGFAANRRELSIALCGFDATDDIEARIVAMVYNKNGIIKKIAETEQFFPEKTYVNFNITVSNIRTETGDSLRIIAVDKSGNLLLKQPLEFFHTGVTQRFSVSNLFSDNMMFQAEQPLTIWGKAPIGAKVNVTLEGADGTNAKSEAVADRNFNWEAELGSFTYGGEYVLTIRCGAEKRVYKNITFGDVWLCVGQSNMDYYMVGGDDTIAYLKSKQGKEEVNNSDIRLVNLWNMGIAGSGAEVENLPLDGWRDSWVRMDKDSANYCSAVAYFFAQDLNKSYDIPIGILSVAVGDTEINRWIPCGDRYGSFTSNDGGLFNNRVSPFSKLKIRGILMYQGEADQYRTNLTAMEYRDAMSGLVDRYREIFGADTPFYWAQLTRYKKDESAVREGQRLALDKIKNKNNAGLISLIDLYGEYESGAGNCREDIHPHQKKEVAERFLRYVKRDVYGEDLMATGPVLRESVIVGDKIELYFDCTGELNILPVQRYADKKGMKFIEKNKLDTTVLQEFEIAGEDRIFVRAEAVADGEKVVLSSGQVKEPKYARYAWGAYPEMPNLTDDSGLPALSFSTEPLE